MEEADRFIELLEVRLRQHVRIHGSDALCDLIARVIDQHIGHSVLNQARRPQMDAALDPLLKLVCLDDLARTGRNKPVGRSAIFPRRRNGLANAIALHR
jgi:hypothetical protein